MAELEGTAGRLRVEDELHQAGAVAKVDEDQPAVVAAAVHPARDANGRPDAVVAAPGRTRRRGTRSAAAPESRLAAHPAASSSTSSGDVHLALLARAHVAKPARPVPLQDHRAARRPRRSAWRIWPFMLRDRRGRAPRASPAWRSSVDQGERALALVVGGGDEDVMGQLCPVALDRQQDPLHARGPADRRGSRPAEQLDQPVVAAPARHLRLGAEARRSGTRTRCGCSSRARGPWSRRARRRCRPARAAAGRSRSARRPRRRGGRASSGASAITARVPSSLESKARSGFSSIRSRTSSVQLGLVLAQVRDQLVSVLAARLQRPEARRAAAQRRHLEPAEQLVEEHDQLGVDERRVGADRLGVELGELAKAPRLGALVAKERAVPPQLHRLRELLHPVLEVGPGDRRGALRAQGDAAPALVVEGEHLLADDVGRPAHAAREQLGVLEGRGLDPPVAGALEELAAPRLDPRPRGRRPREARRRCHAEPGSVRPSGASLVLLTSGPAYRASSARNGFVARSAPSVVTPMWPG